MAGHRLARRALLIGLPIVAALAVIVFQRFDRQTNDAPLAQTATIGPKAASRPVSIPEPQRPQTAQQEADSLARAWKRDAAGVPRWAREAAASIDPNQTYVFFHMSDPKWMLKNHMATLKVVARQNGKWLGNVVFVRVGDKVGTPGFPSDVRLDGLRMIDGKLSITLVDPRGSKRTHFADLDEKTPEFSLLTALCSYGRDWDRSLFGQ